MTKEQLDEMEAAARKRLAQFINRSAAQHLRAMRERVSIRLTGVGSGDFLRGDVLTASELLRYNKFMLGQWAERYEAMAARVWPKLQARI